MAHRSALRTSTRRFRTSRRRSRDPEAESLGLLASPRRQATVAAWAAAVAIFSSVAGAGEIERHRPADGHAVVLALPAGVSRAQAMAADAADPERAAIDAEALLWLARTTRDARYFGRAQALVEPWM